jgi:hypothetical protein
MRSLVAAAAVVVLAAGAAYGQGPDRSLSGTFRLDKAASRITAGVGLATLDRGGLPPTLYLTHAANGTVVVGSDVNESLARLYRVDGPTGFSGEREGVKEQFAISADASRLTVTVTAAAGTTTLVYTRTDKAQPCESWPTPCRW